MIPHDGYITINPAVPHGKFNVVVMRSVAGSYVGGHIEEADYVVFRISPPMPKEEAYNLARRWVSETGLELR
jgi:hypothetical protein